MSLTKLQSQSVDTNITVAGVVTATAFYGDGSNLTGLPQSGIGIGTTGGVVGYGITFIDLKGAGVSTTFYDSNVGIATIFFEGGGGGGSAAIGIGTEFPASPANGDLFYHIDYARTFVYYDEVTLGIGSTAVWVDSAPFNEGGGLVAAKSETSFTATAGQTTFTTPYSVGFIDVYLNGVRLSPTEFTATDGTSVVLSVGASLNDVIDIVEYTMGKGDKGDIGDNKWITTTAGIHTLSNVGIGTTNPRFALEVGAVGASGTSLYVNGDARVTGILTVGTSSITLDGNTNTINAENIVGTAATFNGNVSIAGTLTYEDVTNVDSVGLVTARAGAHVATVSGNLLVATTSATGTASQPLQVTGGAYVSGSFGIGTTNPSSKLHVEQSSDGEIFRIQRSGGSNIPILAFDLSESANTATLRGTGAVGANIAFNAGGQERVRITSGGSVGIATTNPTEKLHVIGNIIASGNVSGYSDKSLKDNIQTIPNALDKVSKLRGVEFDRNDIEGNPHQIGVIAQEVEKIIPEVITTHNDGFKSVAYGNLVGLLIEAIKDLKEEVNELKARLEEV